MKAEFVQHATPGKGGRRSTLVVILLALAMLAVACGSSDSLAIDLNEDSTLDGANQSSDTGETGDTGGTGDTGDTGDGGDSDPPAEPTATPEPEPVERTIEDVQASTIRIAVQGTFQPVGAPDQLLTEWSGTGFFISEDGLAVTNNHVVTGAGTLTITVPGLDEDLNAVVLGASECSDLAVIDVEGSGYQPLEFRTEPVNPGLFVFAAGYPGSGIDGGQIENRDYTVTGGVVSNTTGTGDTQSSSVETVIEHDAKIRGGNSGGPLVDEQARVVGINYFGGDVDDFNLAIAGQEALPIIDMLMNGNSEWIGVAGEAVISDDGQNSGVWVQSVESGSPADNAGVLPGDVIESLEGLPIAQDGTMATYCDVIRSHSVTDVIDITVFRTTTGEELSGQLNGRPLAPFSFETQLADEMVAAGGGGGTTVGAEGYDSYEFIADDTGSVGVEVPAEWNDRNGIPDSGFNDAPSIWAAPDLEMLVETWLVPGVQLDVRFDLGPEDHDEILDMWDLSTACNGQGRENFETTDGAYFGRWEFWEDCGGGLASVITLAASPPDGSFLVRMFFQATDVRDLEAADRAIGTFVASEPGA